MKLLLIHILFFTLTEDFASEIDLTEEEQIKLLEQYEREKKNERKTPKMKKPVGEKIIFKQESPKRDVGKNNDTKNIENPLQSKKVANLDTSSSNSSTDGDWEKITDTEKLNYL